jgi:hypothetical protein
MEHCRIVVLLATHVCLQVERGRTHLRKPLLLRRFRVTQADGLVEPMDLYHSLDHVLDV